MAYSRTPSQRFGSKPFLNLLPRFRHSAILFKAATCGGLGMALLISQDGAGAQPASPPAQRDLILSNWADASWALPAGATLRHNVGQTKNGDPLTRITLAGPGEGQGILTEVNLPPTAGDLSMFIHHTEHGMSRHEALFQGRPRLGRGGQHSVGHQRGHDLCDIGSQSWLELARRLL